MERSATALEDRWDVEALYPSLEEWEKEFKLWAREGSSPHWPEIAFFKGKLKEGPSRLKEALENIFIVERHLSKLYTYAHLRHDEDAAQDVYKSAYGRIASLLYDFGEETSWIEPEILEMEEGLLKKYLEAKELEPYKARLERVVRLKPHTLSADKEELLASSGKALETASKAFSAFNNADMKFPPVKDSSGALKELTHGTYLLYLRGRDRQLRENAFKQLHKSFFSYENTLCELIQGEVQSHLFEARARKYGSCLEAALFPNQIKKEVYTSLIQAVRTRLGSLHRYLSLRKRLLGVDALHLYDMHVPLAAEVDMSMSYPEAAELVADAVFPLGSEYQNTLRQGLLEKRWVDRYENARKRSGAYSSGCYDSMPYILMNYHGTFSDVMTLAHEAGHSMHTLLSSKHQPFHYSRYPIFVAEVASTFNEELLFRHLLNREKDPTKRFFLMNQKIDDIRSTLFRQTMFAEFELRVHQWAEEGVPLTPSLLKQYYRKLNADYFGEEVVLDDELDIEWARIPHFYYNFYVYQYATGISAAHALAKKVIEEGESARLSYIQFLSSGSSLYPLDLLRVAGVDMGAPAPVLATIDYFDDLVEQLSQQEAPHASEKLQSKKLLHRS